MAVRQIIGNQVAGIRYSYRTDDFSDWEDVPTRQYFFDIGTQRSFFKDTNGKIWDLYVNKKAYINYFDFSNNLVTIIDTAGVWEKLNTSTTSLFSEGLFAHQNNRVTYGAGFIGGQVLPIVCQIEGIVSVSAGNNDEVHVAFFKNGQLYPCSEQSVVCSPGGKSSAVPFHCLVELEDQDFIEVYVKNQSSSNNITLDNVNVIVKEL